MSPLVHQHGGSEDNSAASSASKPDRAEDTRNDWRNFLAILDVLLHRAWVSTLGVTVIAFLLIRNDQSRDVLGGLGEALLLFEQLDPYTAWYGVAAYAAFWVSAMLLASALALVAYVTGGSAPSETTKDAVWFSAQIIVLVMLWIIYLAVLWQTRLLAFSLMIVLPAILLAIVFVPWKLLHRGRRDDEKPSGPLSVLTPRRCVLLSISLTVLVFSLVAAVGVATTVIAATVADIGGTLLIAASAATPSLVILAMAAVQPRLPDEYRYQIGVLAFFAVVLTIVVLWPYEPSTIWMIGSAAIAMMWFAWAALILAVVVVLLRGLRNTVGIGIDPILPLVLIAWWLFTGEERLGRENLHVDSSTQGAAAASASTPAQPSTGGTEETIAAIPRLNLAIHADGGGLRAALFTAEVLAAVDDLTCGDFGEQVVALSGVSGGSLGIATWAVMRQEYEEINKKNAWGVCKAVRENPAQPGLNPQDSEHFPLSFRVYGILAQDHLSYALATMLTSDLRPGVDAKRGQALLDSWQIAAHDTLLYYDRSSWGSRQAFAIQLTNVNAGLKRKPLLMFTATDADSGKRIVFLNAEPSASSSIKDVQIAKDLQVGVAALHSARFPLISPAGRAAVGDSERRAVDGGYFDNSGSATLRAMLGEGLNKQVKVIRINGNASDSGDTACGTFHEALNRRGINVSMPRQWTANPESDRSTWSGLKAFMAARTALAEETADALKPLHLQLDYYPGFNRVCESLVLSEAFKNYLPPCVERNIRICWAGLLLPRAPLGWYLSRGAATEIRRSALDEAVRLLHEMPKWSVQ